MPTLDADPGSYSLTGAAATVAAHRRLTISSGTLSVAWSDATLDASAVADSFSTSSRPKVGYPGARVALGYVEIGGKRHPVYIAQPWDRFFFHQWDERLGGDSGPTLSDVETNVVEAKSAATEASSSVSLVVQQSDANAEVAAALRDVAIANALTGATSVPVPVRRAYPTNEIIP